MAAPILTLRKVNKSFGPVHVLKDVDFDAYAGKVTALVGDNGAGKSTLIKCIAGIYTPETGEFIFEGNKVTIAGPRDATSLGIEIVYQDLALCDNLDIVHNMFLGREEKSGMTLNESTMESMAKKDARWPQRPHSEINPPESRIAQRWTTSDCCYCSCRVVE